MPKIPSTFGGLTRPPKTSKSSGSSSPQANCLALVYTCKKRYAAFGIDNLIYKRTVQYDIFHNLRFHVALKVSHNGCYGSCLGSVLINIDVGLLEHPDA